MTAETRHTLLVGLVLGLTAACLVWWLERFEVARLREELAAEWGAFLDEHGVIGETPPEAKSDD
jgi:hypothetical protein